MRGRTWRAIAGALCTGLFIAPVAMFAQPRTTRPKAPDLIRDASCTDTSASTPRVISTAPTLTWRAGLVKWTEWRVLLGTRKLPVTVIVADVDPRTVLLSLEISRAGDAMGPWRIDQAPNDAVIAFNAGQFTDSGPWGWVVHRGREWQAPGIGTLAAGIAVDSGGQLHVLSPDSLLSARQRGGWVEAVQSYPQLLAQGRVPAGLCRSGAINRTHRDIRMAVGVRHDGHVLVALTRYAPTAALPSVTERLPVGPTTLEMVSIMRRLGAQHAVMLDGGLSAQLRVRNEMSDRSWPGLRSVPLAIVGRPR